jgi:cell division protein FtsB
MAESYRARLLTLLATNLRHSVDLSADIAKALKRADKRLSELEKRITALADQVAQLETEE